MKPFITLLTLIALPIIAFAQPADTSTVTDLSDIGREADAIITGFQMSVLAGIAAVFAAVGTVLNYGPLARRLGPTSKLDWLRPLLMLVSVTGAAITGELMLGIEPITAAITGILAGVGSGFLQRTIQEWQD